MLSTEETLRRRIDAVPQGKPGWKRFEDACTDALMHLFVPPLTAPMRQPRTYSGTDRRDAILPNRNHSQDNPWGHLLVELDARMVLFEFKNYSTEPVGKDEVNQTRNYLSQPIGRLGILISRTGYAPGASVKRNGAYSEDKKVILLLSDEDLKEMLYMKERGEDPADLVMDAIERFYVEYE